MAKQDVGPFEYLAQFNKLLANPGALLGTMDRDDKPNVMAIGWAHIGIIWSRRVCVVYVRPSRHSYTCLEQLRQGLHINDSLLKGSDKRFTPAEMAEIDALKGRALLKLPPVGKPI